MTPSSSLESEVWRNFIDGRFSSLKSVKETNIYHRNSLSKDLVDKNNEAVCEFMLASNPKDQEQKSNRAFVETLQTCYSIPVGEETLFTEFTVLYNHLYTWIVCKEGSQSTCLDHNDWFQTVNKTLYRVNKLLSANDTNVLPCHRQSPEECFLFLLENCLPRIAYTGTVSTRLCVVMCMCIDLVCIRGLKDSYTTLQVLERVSNTLENLEQADEWKGMKFEDGLLLPVQLDHRDVHIVSSQSCREFTEYLRALSLYKVGQWQECFQHLQKVKDSELSVIAKFISGWSLYRNREYLESVALLMETLRSQLPLTQRLKARIYNLIAMCFQNLDKAQLALQMYKEALSADFGYLLPLYTTSIMYKKQGNSDMELECLNLLVTAIEMREPSTFVSKRLDLLDLFKEEDTDISYPKALYCFASRALALHKYEVSADKYQALIAYLKSWKGETQAFLCLPTLSQIHQETIHALLKAEKYPECVSMCDKLLTASCYHSDLLASSYQGDTTQTILNDSVISKNSQEHSILLSNNNLDSSMLKSFSFGEELHSSCSAKKRKCSDGQDTSSVGRKSESDIDAVTLKVKAEALLKQGDKDNALSCLDRASDSISRHRKSLLGNLPGSLDEPSAKRRKLDTDGAPCEAGSSATSLDIECDIYRLIEQILTSQDRVKEAQHYKCLQQQLRIVSSRVKE